LARGSGGVEVLKWGKGGERGKDRRRRTMEK
jgi:hypothetical protein